MNTQPWIEKYRPKSLDDIVLNDQNRSMIQYMVKYDKYPNMIFYGPPGTGKTTTILCLINEYQKKHNCCRNYIHLNASHERGVDVIRNQISQFSKNDTFFEIHRKFVLLDEMDSLTKQAQCHLYHVIKQTSSKKITFILICNYLNKVIPMIRRTLLMLHFNQTSLWCDDFINDCLNNEGIKIPQKYIDYIKKNHFHDLRSIVNCLQNYESNHLSLDTKYFRDLCNSNNPNQLLKKYLQEYDLYSILCEFFKYVYDQSIINNHIIDIDTFDIMKCTILNDSHVHFFIHECLPRMRKICKKIE